MKMVIGIDLYNNRAAVMEKGAPKVIPCLTPSRKDSSRLDKLRKLKADAEQYLGQAVTEIVLVEPAKDAFLKREELQKEALRAGLKLVRTLNAPAAAALECCRRSGQERNSLICWMPDRTACEISLVQFDNGTVEILATARQTITGEDWTADAMECVSQVLTDAQPPEGYEALEVHEAVLIGAASWEPEFQAALQAAVGQEVRLQFAANNYIVRGAAIQAGKLAGADGCQDFLLLNVLPMTLGVETSGGVFTPLIERNTTLPTDKRQIFSTANDNQQSVEVHLLAGEKKTAAENYTLGRFTFGGIPPAAKGVPQIEVFLDLDANGLLKVTAKDLSTGKEMTCSATALRSGVLQPTAKPTGGQPNPAPQSATEPPPAGASPVSFKDKEDIIKALLPVYDNLERAMNQPTSDTAYKKGVELTLKELCCVFSSLGVEFYGNVGEEFNPNIHHALLHEQSSRFAENTVSKILQKGVRLNGKILRFAGVQVAN